LESDVNCVQDAGRVRELAAAIQNRSLSPVELLNRYLGRIAEAEPQVQAWVSIDAKGAMKVALEREAEALTGHLRGPLHGIPFAVKDNIDIAGAWPDNITVNAVAPGFVRTDMTQRGRGAGDWQGTEESFAAKAMMGRIGEPEDIANAVVFLASPGSGWITAQMLIVDGGRMDYIGHA
jgi:hypothetical protein